MNSEGDDLYELAKMELQNCQEAINSYDEYLFRIRSWNIAFTALVIGATLGLSEGAGEGALPISPFLIIAIHAIFSSFLWMMDAYSKSIQNIYIDSIRSCESFLRGERSSLYLGPSTHIRFLRKPRRHLVTIIRNVSDDSIYIFYLSTIILVLFSLVGREIISDRIFVLLLPAWNFFQTFNIDVSLALCAVVLGFVGLLWLTSLRWRANENDSMRWRSKYIFRQKLLIRRILIHQINEKFTKSAQRDVNTEGARVYDANNLRIKYEIGPFDAEFYHSYFRKILFIDRYKISLNRELLGKRNDLLRRAGYCLYRTKWVYVGHEGVRLIQETLLFVIDSVISIFPRFIIDRAFFQRWTFPSIFLAGWKIQILDDGYKAIHPLSQAEHELALLDVRSDIIAPYFGKDSGKLDEACLRISRYLTESTEQTRTRQADENNELADAGRHA